MKYEHTHIFITLETHGLCSKRKSDVRRFFSSFFFSNEQREKNYYDNNNHTYSHLHTLYKITENNIHNMKFASHSIKFLYLLHCSVFIHAYRMMCYRMHFTLKREKSSD